MSDLYALGLPVLLFQRFVDEDILLLSDCGLWGLWMDNATTPPNAHPFSESIDFIGTQHKKLVWYLCLLIHYWQLLDCSSCSTIPLSTVTKQPDLTQYFFHSSDQLCKDEVQGHPERMDAPGVHRSLIRGGTSCVWQDR